MMPFQEPFSLYYESIYKPAIGDANLRPVRADDLFRPSAIVADLWTMIQDAEVLLAELTTKNANVFYELGLAHALGKPVVLVSETMGDVPFDLQQLRVLLYDKDDPSWGDKIKVGVTSALKETLDSPVEAVPNIFRTRVESEGPEQDALAARVEAMESQIRGLRMRSTLPGTRPIRTPWYRDLDEVTNEKLMDSWFKKWTNRKISISELLSCVRIHDDIPDSEEDRLRENLNQPNM